MNRTTLATFLFAAATALGAQEPPTRPTPPLTQPPAPDAGAGASPADAWRVPSRRLAAPRIRRPSSARCRSTWIMVREQALEAARMGREVSRIDMEAAREAQMEVAVRASDQHGPDRPGARARSHRHERSHAHRSDGARHRS